MFQPLDALAYSYGVVAGKRLAGGPGISGSYFPPLVPK